MNRRLLLIFVLLISLLPSLYLAYLHTVDAFLYTPLSEISTAFYSGTLSGIDQDQPTYVIILYTISAICNIPPLQLAYMPIGALIFPFCIYALARKILKSRTIPILLLLYFALDFSVYQGQYGVLAYSWAHPLFFIFVLLYIIYSNAEKRNPGLIALILLTFTCIVFLHPTYVFWAISFAIALNVLIAVSRATKLSKVKLIPTPFLTIALFVIYFGFNQLYFGFYVHRILLVEPEAISEQFFALIRTFLGFAAPLAAPYQIFLGAPTAVIGYAAFARTSILVSFIAFGLLSWIKNNRHEFSKHADNIFILAVALLIAGMMHTIGYAAYGHISMRFMLLMFPILAVLFLRRGELRRAVNVMVTLIIVLALVQTMSYAASEPKVNDIDIETARSTDWLITHSQGEVALISDFTTSQIMTYYFKSVGKDMTQRFYSSELYSQVVTGEDEITAAEYVAVNWELKATISVGWATFEPLSNYVRGVSENVHLNNIYDDGRINIFKSNSFE